jgi:acyl carrier protein
MVGEGTQTIGDVFVCTSKREVVAMMVGVPFAKVKISKMMKLLLSANATVCVPKVEHEKEVLEHIHIPHKSSIEPKPSDVAITSEANLEIGVKEIIWNYTGLDPLDIPSDVVLADLGIDSLSSIEFVAQVQSIFGLEISSDELANLTLDGLIGLISKHIASEAQSTNGGRDADSSVITIPSTSTTPFEGVSLPNSVSDLHSTSVTVTELVPSKVITSSNPFEAFVATDRRFEIAAQQRGYTNYHKNVFPIQNSLTLAYILEAFKSLGVDLWSLSPGSVIPPLKNIPKHNKVVSRFWISFKVMVWLPSKPLSRCAVELTLLLSPPKISIRNLFLNSQLTCPRQIS